MIASQPSTNCIITFLEKVTVVVGSITIHDEANNTEVSQLVQWCKNNNMSVCRLHKLSYTLTQTIDGAAEEGVSSTSDGKNSHLEGPCLEKEHHITNAQVCL